MELKLPTILLGLSLLTTLSFKVGDEIELDSFLNGRTNPNFLKTTKNIKTTLNAGTTGSVLDIKNFHSGNSGIKMKVTSGPHTGESYWVYYNKNSPALKLSDKKGEKTPEEISLKNSPKAEITRSVAATRDLGESALIETAQSAGKINSQVKDTITAPVLDCPPKVEKKPEVVLSSVPEDSYQVSDQVAPFRDRPREREMTSVSCRHKSNGSVYAICKTGDDPAPSRFSIYNGGPNNIVSTNEYYINRTFEFEYPDRAKSDMKLTISDAPDEYTSHTTYSIMLFFPRTTLPSIKERGNELDVTLPNGELVTYNAKTGEIVGGVLTEGKMGAFPKAPDIKYNGNGVVIRASKAGNLPQDKGNITTISKKGHKNCQINSQDLWYTNPKSKDILVKPEYASDEGLDSFLKKKCGFSLF